MAGHDDAPPDLVVVDLADLDGDLTVLLEHAKRRWPHTFFSLLTDQRAETLLPVFERYGHLPIIAATSEQEISRAIEKEMVGLVNGNLQGLLLSSFLQMMEWETKSVSIHVSAAAEQWGRIHLFQGKFVSAYVHGQTLSDEQAATEILMWDNVSIAVERSYHNQKTGKLTALSSLIMDAMVKKDEIKLTAPAEPAQPEPLPEAPAPDLSGNEGLSKLSSRAASSSEPGHTAARADWDAGDVLVRSTHFGETPAPSRAFDYAEVEGVTLNNETFEFEDAPYVAAPPSANTFHDQGILWPGDPEEMSADEMELYIIQNSGRASGPRVTKTQVDEPNVREVLSGEVMAIDGAVAAALLEYSTGITLERVGVELGQGVVGQTSIRKIAPNPELLSASMCQTLRDQRQNLDRLGISDHVEDMVVTLGQQYHLLYLLPGTSLFIHMTLQKDLANLPLARHLLKIAANGLRL